MLFYLGGSVGIGTATPLATFHVEPGTSGEGILLPGLRVGQNTGSPNVIGGFRGNIYDHLSQGSTIGGGIGSCASGTSATVVGGADNAASGEYVTVAGGQGNRAAGNYSFAAGP